MQSKKIISNLLQTHREKYPLALAAITLAEATTILDFCIAGPVITDTRRPSQIILFSCKPVTVKNSITVKII